MKSSSTERFFSEKEKGFKWKEDIPMKGTTNPLYTAIHERRVSVRPQPKNTVLYEVRATDTLSSVAARFNTTPSELVNLNRLISRTLFSGQIIYVPDNGESSSSAKPETLTEESVNGQKSPKPGHAERIQLLINKHHCLIEEEENKSPSQIAEDLNTESSFRFLKINAKYITDGEGVVNGVLLVTPNHLVFDPNVSDVLVIEHGPEKYNVVAPLYMVVRAALYPDIVRMRVKDVLQTSSYGKRMQPYRSTRFTLKKSRSHDDKFNIEVSTNIWEKEDNGKSTTDLHPPSLTKICECSPETTAEPQEDNSTPNKDTAGNEESPPPSVNEGSESESFTVVDNSDSGPLVIDVPSPSTSQPPESQSSCEEELVADPEEEDETVKKKGSFGKTKQKIQKGLRRLSIGESIFPANSNRRLSLPITSSFTELKAKVSPTPMVKKTKSKETKQKPERPSPSYVNMVDDKPDLLASLEKDAFFNYMELIPRPAKSFDDNPLYLCLRMGQPLKESSSRYTPVVPFGHRMKSEYWFSIPRNKVDSLYFFFLRWAPEKYGDVDDINMEELGYSLIPDDEVLEEPPAAFVPIQRRSTWAFPWRRKKSNEVLESNWEFLDSNESNQREPSLTESELSLPELSSPSNILSEEHLIQLNKHLPPRAVGYTWELIYSTSVNGFSLKTLYREMVNINSPVLLVIATTSGAIFGAMLSHPLRISDHFYGTGESYVYTFYPEFKHFPWAGENNYFIKGNTCSFAIGASDGQFGLWLDDDLYHGCSKQCQTFNNECLSDEEDFVVKSLEVWGFV